jgi:biopolymer transport protein ExbB/TolQ
LTTATFAVDIALDGNRAVRIVGCCLAIGVIITWFYVVFMMLRAIHLKQILWPQKQEDRNEGGWLEGDERMKSADRRRETIFRRASAVRNNWRENEHRLKPRKMKSERELSHDRADYIIKELSGRPIRGRSGHE